MTDIPTPLFCLQFSHEFDDVFRAEGEEADKWNHRIKQFGPLLVLLWLMLTHSHKAVPSDKGLMVWGKEGVIRLGSAAMMYKPEWRLVHVVDLVSSRQKAWLHGVSFDMSVPATPSNQDERGRMVE